ncbi:MAG: response regulator transcription factor [Campylobacterales bacterium]|nr:response regulator transcription factor [Campylobacterales bacterium]
MKILLLEDEYMLLSSIRTFLLQKLHSVDTFESGKEAMEAFLETPDKYDMFILDINTHEMSGLDFLKVIRESGNEAPVIMITAQIDISSIDKAYDLGCSEYLKKPFNLRELELRMQKLTPVKKEQNQTVIKISENYTFDLKTKNLLFKNMPENLTKRQTLFVTLLVNNRNRIIDYDKIKSFVWGEDEYVEDSTIRSLVNRLRNELKEDFIVNHRGVGYAIEGNNS